MGRRRTYRSLLVTVAMVCATVWCAEEVARGQGGRNAKFQYGPAESLSQILGRPTRDSVTLSVLSALDIEAYVEFGDKRGDFSRKTGTLRSNAGSPFEFKLDRLQPDTRYVYRLCSRLVGNEYRGRAVQMVERYA